MADLSGKKVLAVVSNRGVEQDELRSPLKYLKDAGAEVSVAAPESGVIKSLVGDWDRGEDFTVDLTLDQAAVKDYDLLLLPGGTLNADSLRGDSTAQSIAKAFADSGRPIASICHGPWLLVETGLVKGKTLTSYKSIKTDVMNAGGNWEDKQVVKCPANNWVLLTSRNPGDLDAFNQAIAEELAH